MRDRVIPPKYQLKFSLGGGNTHGIYFVWSKRGGKDRLLESLWVVRLIAYFAFPSSDEGLSCSRRLPGALAAFLSGFEYETWRPRSIL